VWDEESGELHRELEGLEGHDVEALATFLSPDGQQVRLVAGSGRGHLKVYDPDAGSVLHDLEGHADIITGLACTASSSAAPHHPRLVSASLDGTAKVWDGETGERLADLRGHQGSVFSVAVWKEHTGGRDRIATASRGRTVKIWDGEAFTLLHDLDCGASSHVLALDSAEGPTRLQVWGSEEGRLLHEGINLDRPFTDCHLFESAEGRQLLAVTGSGVHHRRQPGDTRRGPFSMCGTWARLPLGKSTYGRRTG
jgi:WD40 repeat protein